MRLHERTGTVDRYEPEGRDPYAKQVIRWDDPTKCCGHPDCLANPRPEQVLRGSSRIAVSGEADGVYGYVWAEAGTRVRTWWDKDATRGGITGAVIGKVEG